MNAIVVCVCVCVGGGGGGGGVLLIAFIGSGCDLHSLQSLYVTGIILDITAPWGLCHLPGALAPRHL